MTPARTKYVVLLVPFCIGLILILTSTTHLIEDFWNYDTKRLLELALLPFLFAFTLLYSPLRNGFALQLQQVSISYRFLLVTVFFIGIISSVYHAESLKHAYYSITEVLLLTSLVLAVLVIAAARTLSGQAFDHLAVGVLVLLGLGVGVQELMGVLAASNIGMEFNFRISLLHFSWPRFFNQVQSWTLPVLAALPALFWRKPLARILCICVIGLNWYVLLMTGARGTVVGVVSAIIIILLLFPSARRETVKWHVMGLALGVVIYLTVLSFWMSGSERGTAAQTPIVQIEGLKDTEEGRPTTPPSSTQNTFFAQSMGRKMVNTSGRWAMWKGTINDIRENPLLGIGPMNFACNGRLNEAGHPHSFPLQLAAEWGLPAALALLLALARLGLTAVRNLRTGRYESDSVHLLAILLAAGVLAAAIHACLSGVLVMPASQLTGVLICGWLLGVLSPSTVSETIRGLNNIGYRQVAVSAFLVLILLINLSVLTFSLRETSLRQDTFAATAPGDRLIPRFWQNGKACGM